MRGIVALFASALLATGCAKDVPVEVAMVSAHDRPTDFAFVPRTLDVRHAEDGWLRVPLTATAQDLELLEYGHRIELATTNLPRGDYTGLRVTYLVPVPEPERTVRPASRSADSPRRVVRTSDIGRGFRERQVTIQRPFCIDRSGDDRILLQVQRSHPAYPEEGPTISVIQLPRC